MFKHDSYRNNEHHFFETGKSIAIFSLITSFRGNWEINVYLLQIYIINTVYEKNPTVWRVGIFNWLYAVMVNIGK